MQSTQKKRVIILGAGFGGLRTAFILGKAIQFLKLESLCEVVLIDRNDHHTYTPLLYEIATTPKEVANIIKLHALAAYHIPSIISDLPVHFIQDEIVSLHPEQASLRLKNNGELSGDYLVLAMGSETNYYSILGLQEYSFKLKTFQDAIRIREYLDSILLDHQGILKIIIGGGGSTGVELAAELAMCKKRFKNTPTTSFDISIIEAQETILPGFHPAVVRKVSDRLKKIGVTVLGGARIQSLKPDVVVLEKKEVPFDMFIWTGGVRGSSLLTETPLKDEKGYIDVVQDMQCLPHVPNLKLSSRLYALGDTICVLNPKTGKRAPWVARAAIDQANVAGHNIIQDILHDLGKQTNVIHETYEAHDYPYIIPVGAKFAVAKIGPIILSGFSGWILKGLVELNYLISIMPLRQAFTVWLKGLRTFLRSERLG